ncbi:class IIb bacteriocin, lactobin A/cerein 7B family [Flavobacterium sp. ACN6]|uniref:class IIb bacteriocin, lactobin A/cerein 7B family n=1 Tax=Flavobacterium sp. ACN6 TaxID=1920426 RepID=UPI001DE24509|nr:class IIb bacteriocin, lactobin A/cerein 7B family [Flavobacterium sp. ACN6]PBJ11469.1 hypothetical protein BSF42_28730 [Flavobacterium sp. ACN6]
MQLELVNLDDLNLAELNAQEIKEVEGGWIVPVLRGLAYLGLMAVAYHDANCEQCNK